MKQFNVMRLFKAAVKACVNVAKYTVESVVFVFKSIVSVPVAMAKAAVATVKELRERSRAIQHDENGVEVEVGYNTFDAVAKAKLAKAIKKFTTKHNADPSAFDYSVYANKHGYNLSDIMSSLATE